MLKFLRQTDPQNSKDILCDGYGNWAPCCR